MSRACMQTRLAAVVSGLFGLLALPSEVAAAPSDPGADDVSSHRPRIGLVLAGGGAKGGAHVGVLKVLEEQRVPIDCIAGTSMGALVGAGYASGLPAAELEEFVTGIDWQSVVGGVGRRSLQPIEQKRLETAASASGELGFKGGQIVTPGGLTNTSAIDDVLRTYVARARMVPDFDQLPIPYRAVATDMVTGEMVVLKSGDLATAMRASMAIPGAFAPVTVDKYILADGGMVRNIPVDIARETCADVVIVVNLVEPSTPPERLVQATQLLARSMDVMLEANERRAARDADRTRHPHRRSDRATSVPPTSRAYPRRSRSVNRRPASSRIAWRPSPSPSRSIRPGGGASPRSRRSRRGLRMSGSRGSSG